MEATVLDRVDREMKDQNEVKQEDMWASGWTVGIASAILSREHVQCVQGAAKREARK